MSGYAILISANGQVDTMEVAAVDLEFMQEQVGGYIERVTLDHVAPANQPPVPVDLYVDEEGLLKSLPQNGVASLLGRQFLHGPCLIVGNDGPDNPPLTEDQRDKIIEWMVRVVEPENVVKGEN